MAVAVERTKTATGASPPRRASPPPPSTRASAARSPTSRVVRSTVPAVGAAMFTANRVQAAPVLVSKAHLAQAEPQAVVINSGVANAATGKQGELDALATAGHTAALLGLDAGAGARPLDRRDRREAADGLSCSPGSTSRRRAVGRTAAPTAAEAILTTDTTPKEAVVSRGGFTVGGMAKGAGMIHPRLATMLAVVTTDYPLDAGEAQGFLKRVGRRELQPDLRRRRVLDERRRDPARQRRERDRADAGDRPRLRRRAAARSAPTSRARSSWTARARPCCSRSRSPAPPATARRTRSRARIATSPLVKTAAFGRDPNWGRILAAAGSAFVAGGFAQVDVDRLTLRINGVAVFAAGEPTGAEVPLEGAVCTDRPRPRARRGERRLPRLRPHVRLREDQRGVHDVIVREVRRRGRGEAAAEIARARGDRGRSSSCTAPARRSRPSMERRGLDVDVRPRPAGDRRGGARGRPRGAARRQRARSARRSAPEPSASSATRSASRRRPSRSSGSSATRCRAGPRPCSTCSPPAGSRSSRRSPRGR